MMRPIALLLILAAVALLGSAACEADPASAREDSTAVDSAATVPIPLEVATWTRIKLDLTRVEVPEHD